MTRETWAVAVARGIGITGALDYTTTRVGQTLHIPCAVGDHKVDVEVPPGRPPEMIARRMLNEGWTFGRKLTCPEHGRKRQQTKEPEIVAEEPKPSPAAGKAKRLVYMALEDHYDEAAKGYRPNHSDATIAKACGISEALVKTIREESYGPLGTPPELAEVREEMQALFAAVTATSKDLDRLRQRLDALVRRNGWTE